MAIDFDGASSSVETGITPEERFDRQFARKMPEHQARQRARLSMLVSKGTLDWAHVTFIISSTAAAMDWDVSVFFTFYGLGSAQESARSRYRPPRQSGDADENAVRPQLV